MKDFDLEDHVVSLTIAGTSTNYASLQEAINAAVDAAINHNQYNSRITLLKDTEGTLDLSNIETTRSLRIDLEFNRKTFTATDTIKLDQDISLQINNGTITSTDNVNTLVEISDNHSELSFRNDVTVDATKLKTGGYIANVTGGRVNLFGKVNEQALCEAFDKSRDVNKILRGLINQGIERKDIIEMLNRKDFTIDNIEVLKYYVNKFLNNYNVDFNQATEKRCNNILSDIPKDKDWFNTFFKSLVDYRKIIQNRRLSNNLDNNSLDIEKILAFKKNGNTLHCTFDK